MREEATSLPCTPSLSWFTAITSLERIYNNYTYKCVWVWPINWWVWSYWFCRISCDSLEIFLRSLDISSGYDQVCRDRERWVQSSALYIDIHGHQQNTQCYGQHCNETGQHCNETGQNCNEMGQHCNEMGQDSLKHI